MNLFQTIWISLTTPNEGIVGIIFNNWGIPFIFIELTLNVLLFTTILNIPATKKQKVLCVLLLSLISGISSSLLNKPYSAFINMVIYPIIIMLIFKVNPIKAIIAEFMPFIIIVIIETIFCKIGMLLFDISYEELYIIPLTRIFIAVLIYITTYFIYLAIKHYKLNITIIETMNKKNKSILILNFIFAIIVIAMQFYIIGYYIDKLPFFITLLSVISLIVYSSVSIFSLIKTTKLEETTQSLEEAQLYNKTLGLLHDNLRIFKHDFCNIMQSFEGYIINNDMAGLEKYYKGIKNECDNLHNLTALSPKLINDSALYSLIASKYIASEELDITFNVNINVNFKEIQATPYILTRILGVLLDNAIDAAANSKEKEIFFEVTGPFKNTNCQKHIISIQNSYSNKDVDIDRIREKGYTSKGDEQGSHGLGLWEINKILKKSKNLNLHTSKTEKFFRQDLEIFNLN